MDTDANIVFVLKLQLHAVRGGGETEHSKQCIMCIYFLAPTLCNTPCNSNSERGRHIAVEKLQIHAHRDTDRRAVR